MNLILPLIIFTLLLSGCAGTAPYELKDNRLSVVWPAPPEPTRIRYLAHLKGPADLVEESSNIRKILDLITGEEVLPPDFITPSGIVFANGHLLLVTDPAARAVHYYDLTSRTVKYIREAGGVPLLSPVGVAVSPDGSIYVSDSSLARVFRFSSELQYLGELQGPGFLRPTGIAITHDGEKIVVDVLAHRLLLFDKNDSFVRYFPENSAEASLNRPTSVAVDREKTVYISDSLNFRIVQYGWDGKKLREFGQPGDTPGFFSRPKGISVDSSGHLYVVDATMNIVQIFDREGQLLLPFGGLGKRPGEFDLPSGIFIDEKDRIFVADTYNRRIQVFQYVKESLK